MKVIQISYFDLFDKNVSAIYLVCPRANIIFLSYISTSTLYAIKSLTQS